MSDQCQQENYTVLVTTIVSVGVMIVSEILPFVKSLEGNGVVDLIMKSLKKRFPTPETV
jgi:hypothetical protein